jgi:hypothetical protein
MKVLLVIGALSLIAPTVAADPLNCNMSKYKVVAGLSAVVEQDTLVVTWNGTRGSEIRLRFAIDKAQPLIREMAIRTKGGAWAVLGNNLRPEYEVTAGRRRVDELRLRALHDMGEELTPEAMDREKWLSSWDAPLSVPGVASGHLGVFPGVEKIRALMGLPRKPEEISRASATYSASSCEVATDGARVTVAFDGLSMGIFSGRLQYTMFRGTNLIRQEAIAKTEQPSVAYKYAGGMTGFSTQSQKIRWRDTGGDWQKYEFGGTANITGVPLRARNRVAIVEGTAGSIAVFPPPHKFFFSRETEINLGYVWYRKNDATSFAVGVRHGDHEEPFRPQATTVAMRTALTEAADKFADADFALYNAPPGTWQRMAVFFYVTPDAAVPTQEAVLAFTNGDRYRPLAGYQILMSHIHPPFSDELRDAGTLDVQPPWIPAVKARGINIAMLADRGSSAADDSGPVRYPRLRHHFDAALRHSDVDFAIVSGEEQTKYFPDGGNGHWISYFPKPVFWSQSRRDGQPFVEQDPVYGKVYHVGSSADMLELLKRENGGAWMAHQREKFDLSAGHGYLEKIRNTDYFRSNYYLGGEFRANVPTDLSETRMADVALDALDDMNNWISDGSLNLKTLRASTDTYTEYPEDDVYPESFVNYVKLERVPTIEDSTSFLRALRDGEFFVSSGEILLKGFSVTGAGPRRTVVMDFDWTFPLDFIEIVSGDGTKTERQIISATDLAPFSGKRFSIPIEVAGKKWVRVAAWDCAGNGAFSQPLRLTPPTSTASK